MNETTLEDIRDVLLAYEDKKPINEVFLDNEIQKWAKIALDRMLELSQGSGIILTLLLWRLL